MHMSDAIISPIIGSVMWGTSLLISKHSTNKITQQLNHQTIPLMGVMGAFVFAGQMLNFTIPGTGASGHIGGGMLLSAILGPYAAFLSMAVVLLIQSLFFADGGLLAYGCNLFNLGFFTCFIAYPLIYKPIVFTNPSKKRLVIGTLAATLIGLQLGALGVVFETFLSGRIVLNLSQFLIPMQSIHLGIGLVEGIITSAILLYMRHERPELLDIAPLQVKSKPLKPLILVLMIGTLLLGGFLSFFASSNPDGLEWALEKLPNFDLYAIESGETRPTLDYSQVTGPLGSLLTFVFIGIIGLLLKIWHKQYKSHKGTTNDTKD